jgi:hypothetical protein
MKKKKKNDPYNSSLGCGYTPFIHEGLFYHSNYFEIFSAITTKRSMQNVLFGKHL